MFHRYDLFSVSACQIQVCPVMTGLLAGPLTDASGLALSLLTWPVSCSRSWNPPAFRCGSATATGTG
jgi:hypothetical protein